MAISQWTDLANEYGARFAVPPALILSIIDMESGGNPNDVNPVSHATGLMQITSVVLKDYNERNNTSFTLEDCKDPATNLRIGVELLKRISMTYEKYNALPPRWDNPVYAGLVVLGWNSGYSNKAGVSYVLAKLVEKGIDKSRWSVGLVHQAALSLDTASRFLKEPRRIAWTKKVVERYTGIEDSAKKRFAEATTENKWSPGTKALVYTGVGIGILGVGYMLLASDSESAQGGAGLLAGHGPPIVIINRK